jgi:DNA polymerase III epsilon subunit-like protein
VPFKIQQLIGVSQDKISQAPTLQSLTGKILSFVKSYPIVGHTVEMDMQFMNRQELLLQNLAIDTFELASILVPEVQRYSLASLASFLGISVSQSHRALPDALATKDLFLALVARAYEWDLDTLDEIVQLSANAIGRCARSFAMCSPSVVIRACAYWGARKRKSPLQGLASPKSRIFHRSNPPRQSRR